MEIQSFTFNEKISKYKIVSINQREGLKKVEFSTFKGGPPKNLIKPWA